MKSCILCEKPLDTAKTNLEHYVPAVAIRNFTKLGIPNSFDWALRINLYRTFNDSERIIVGRKADKTWATVRVHQKCNQDASHMCQDLKFIIDHLDGNIPASKFKSIIEYYAHIWGLNTSMVTVQRYDAKEAARRLSEFERSGSMLLYTKGLIDFGHFTVCANTSSNEPGVEKHTIYLGKKAYLERI